MVVLNCAHLEMCEGERGGRGDVFGNDMSESCGGCMEISRLYLVLEVSLKSFQIVLLCKGKNK